MKIISVSGVQGMIDWFHVRDTDAAVVRFSHGGDADCCFGIAPEMDELAERNLLGCYAVRIACGVSHLLGGTTVFEVRAEAAWLIRMLRRYTMYLTLPIVALTLGENGISDKFKSFSASHNAILVKTFCAAIRRAGFTPVLCADQETLNAYLERHKLGSLGIWYARPFVSEALAQKEEPEMLFWQYSTETSPKNNGIYADYPVSRTENFMLPAVHHPIPRFMEADAFAL